MLASSLSHLIMRKGAPITSQGSSRLYSFSFEFRPLFSYCCSLLRHAANVFAPYPFPPPPPPCIKYGNNGQFQKISIPNHGWLPCFIPPCLRKLQNVLPPMPSEFHNLEPPPPPLQNFRFFGSTFWT